MNNEKKEKDSNDLYVIDIAHIAKVIWHRAWIIIVVSILAGAIGFCIASFAISPTYSSSIMLYVNNSSFSLGNTSFSISSSEITAAQSLVKTYGEILNNRTTLERVIDKSGVDYTYKELSKMIAYGSSNNTEIMYVEVTTEDPYESSKIANCIAEVLPVRISEIISGASMEVVDSATPNFEKVAPSITKYTAVGFAIGFFVATAVLVVVALLDNTIHDEEYVINTYEYPILAKIPNLLDVGSKKYGYRYYYKKHSDSGKEGNLR